MVQKQTLTIYRGLLGPRARNPEKSQKKVFERVFSRIFPGSRDFSGTFSRLSGGPGRRPRGTFVRLLRGFQGPEGPREPCKWSTGSQNRILFWNNFSRVFWEGQLLDLLVFLFQAECPKPIFQQFVLPKHYAKLSLKELQELRLSK